ncbi:MAG: CAP domain-containing protein [Brevundimonas sp.]|nr:MAG: CAP domain-containing protein [Brevundimonas sp.]
MLGAVTGLALALAFGEPDGAGASARNDRTVSDMAARVTVVPSAAYALTPEYRLSRNVIEEINTLRADPAAYARHLEDYRSYFVGDSVYLPGETPYMTVEGVSAVDEAIADLRSRQPMRPFRPEGILDWAASDHVFDQGPRGGRGHFGSNGRGPTERAANRGYRDGVAENISYGMTDARAVVIQLLVDDSARTRAHRHLLFSDRFASVGAGCGGHRSYGSMCVIDFGI